MKKQLLYILALFLGAHSQIFASEVRDFLSDMFSTNNQFVASIEHEDFKKFADLQTPRATVVSCSDSRVQTKAYHQNPMNDLFYIRNIGNQIKTAEGSIEYGIHHLHTPILLIIGHSQCGAVKTALGDYSALSEPIQQELNNLHLKKGSQLNAAIAENVHHQVKYAVQKFKDKIADNSLIVIGVIYDFRDDFQQGHGRLLLINLNGEQDPEKIKASDYLKGLNHIQVGVQK